MVAPACACSKLVKMQQNKTQQEFIVELCAKSSCDEWLSFVSQVFAKTGRQYFERHLANDPWQPFENVFIIRNEHAQIIGSIRLMNRSMQIGVG